MTEADPFLAAVALHRAGRLAEAEPLYRVALADRPTQADALHLLGMLLFQSGRAAEAEPLLAAANAARPGFLDALHHHGLVLLALGDAAAALARFDAVLGLAAGHPPALVQRGRALLLLDRPAEAAQSLERALARSPEDAEAWYRLGIARAMQGALAAAGESYARSLALRPGHPGVLYEQGLALAGLEQREAAIAAFDAAIARVPGHAEALNNRGIALAELRRLPEALASYDAALAARPGYAEARLNRGLCRLLAGDLAGGFADAESRWDPALLGDLRQRFGLPVWDGVAPLAGRRVLVFAEQGLGDTLQFIRYLPLLAARGAAVVVQVQRPLRDLLRGIAGATVIGEGEPTEECELVAPLLSLPHLLRVGVPDWATYLAADPALLAEWQARLGPRRGPRIGLAWAGNASYGADRHRSLPLAALAPLWDSGAELISLQKELPEADAAWLAGRGGLRHFGPQQQGFADTAALVAAMDGVIAVNTSLAHLAGAMGKPVLLLLGWLATDWRWPLDRARSPWYPTAAMFRQPGIGDWDGAVQAALRALPEILTKERV